jgi:hypothetical protein
MAWEIAKHVGRADPIPKRGAKKEPDYLGFIASLPCIIERRADIHIEVAHLSFANRPLGHYGRAKGRKASDRWTLPLCSHQHAEQHRQNEMKFWEEKRINPHLACLVIWGLFTEAGEDAQTEVCDLIYRGSFRT